MESHLNYLIVVNLMNVLYFISIKIIKTILKVNSKQILQPIYKKEK
jgi:hypothetical protein